MATSQVAFEPPSDNATTYCRLCLSVDVNAVYPSEGDYSEQDIIRLCWKQLGIQLTLRDFPCALCLICREKLEELHICNADGLLDTWGDEDLTEFKRSCQAVDDVVKRHRRVNGYQATADAGAEQSVGKRVILPFHQLSDGRYKCNVCVNEVYDAISSCITHCQVTHPDDSLSDITPHKDNYAEGRVSRNQSFDCMNCSASFDLIDDLIAHRETHQSRKQASNSNGNEGESAASQSQASKRKRQVDASDELEEYVVTVNNAFKCVLCDESFEYLKNCYFHLNVTHNKNVCDVCGEPFGSPSKLVRHRRTHNFNSVTFPCRFCMNDFLTAQSLHWHIESTHVPSADPQNPHIVATCPNCFETFETTDLLTEHYSKCPYQVDQSATASTSEHGSTLEDPNKIVEISDDDD